MKKLVNLRVPVLIALALAAGIGLGKFFKFHNIDIFYLWIAAPTVTVLSLILYFCRRSIKPVILLFVTVAVMLSGFLVCYFKIKNFETKDLNTSAACAVYGTVCEKAVYDNYLYAVLDDVYVNGKSVNYKISVKCYDSDVYFDDGYDLYFQASLTKTDIYAYGSFRNDAVDNIKYTCSASSLRVSYKFNLFTELRVRLSDTLYDNLSPSTAGVCYAMLTGNTGNVEAETLDSFRYGGIAHIFAVSGLHIGIIYGLLSFLCRRLRVNRTVATAICLFAVFFYAGFCGFTSSALRAAIMCTVLAVANRLFQKYDGLNSFAVAVIILLIINPFYLFNVGFQLSVCAVGGISVFSKQFEKMFTKIKIPRKLSSAAAVTLSAQIAVVPVMINTFGYVSYAGLLLNILIVPVLSVFFAVLFVCTVTCMLVPLGSFIMPVIVLPYEFVASYLIGSGFENAVITGFGGGLFTPLFFIGLLFLTDKINFGKYARIVGATFSACVLTLYMYAAAYYPLSGYDIIISAYYNGGEVLIKSRFTSVLIVTDDATTHPKQTLNKYYSSKPTAVIILGGENAVMSFPKLDIDCDDIFLATQIPIHPFENTTVHYNKIFVIDGVTYNFENNYSISIDIDGVGVCVCANENIPYETADLIISKYPSYACNSPNHVYFSLTDYRYNVKDCGDIRFTVRNGTLTMT